MPSLIPYFAFGANMARRVLVGRRGIAAEHSIAGFVDDHAVRFVVPGVPWLEPAFAGLVRSPGEVAHGVVHFLSARHLARLDVLERSYDREHITVQTANGPLHATTYIARRTVPERSPSRRYRDLLIEGALEHGLPAARVAHLRATPTAHVPLLSTGLEFGVAWVERALRAVR